MYWVFVLRGFISSRNVGFAGIRELGLGIQNLSVGAIVNLDNATSIFAL